jgi:hypothetical protein
MSYLLIAEFVLHQFDEFSCVQSNIGRIFCLLISRLLFKWDIDIGDMQ